MSIEQHKAIVRRYFADFNRHDLTTAAEIVDADYILDFPGGLGSAYGLAGLRRAAADFSMAFPDLHFALEELIGEGDRVAAYWIMHATHGGSLGGIPATHRQVTLTGTSILRFVGSKIAADRVRADMLSLLRQIGASAIAEPVGL